MKYIGSDCDRSKPKKLGCSAIAMPSEPPVTSRHFSATEKTSCEKASVSIRNGMPPVRTQKKPIRAAPAAATTTPAATPSQALSPNCAPRIATA